MAQAFKILLSKAEGILFGFFLIGVTIHLVTHESSMYLVYLVVFVASTYALTRSLEDYTTEKLSVNIIALNRIKSPFINSVKVAGRPYERISEFDLVPGDLFEVSRGEIIPVDGIVVDGVAAVDESAITGESAPVIREAVEDRCSVTAGSRVLTSNLTIRCLQPLNSGADKTVIDLIAGSDAPQTRSQKYLSSCILTAGFMLMISFFVNELLYRPKNLTFSLVALSEVGLFLSALRLTGSQLQIAAQSFVRKTLQLNFLPKSSDLIYTLGKSNLFIAGKSSVTSNLESDLIQFFPAAGTSDRQFAEVAQIASIHDETSRGRLIVVYAKKEFNIRTETIEDKEIQLIPFSSTTQTSGVNIFDLESDVVRTVMKGSPRGIRKHIERLGGRYSGSIDQIISSITRKFGTPLLVSVGCEIVGAIGFFPVQELYAKSESLSFSSLKKIGIRSILLTGDHPQTTSVVANKLRIDAVIAGATPERKLEVIRENQRKAQIITMVGSSASDAAALAQANVGISMNTGSSACQLAAGIRNLGNDLSRINQLFQTGQSFVRFCDAASISLGLLFLTACVSGLLLLTSLSILNLRQVFAVECLAAALCYLTGYFLLIKPAGLDRARSIVQKTVRAGGK